MGGPDAGQRPARGNGTVILRACEAISDIILRCERSEPRRMLFCAVRVAILRGAQESARTSG
jgi:hypothetical protein